MKPETTTEEIFYRHHLQDDDPALIGAIVSSTGFFRESEIRIAVEIAEEQLANPEKAGYHFIFAEHANRIAAYSCYGQVPGTDGCFDLYWIATHSDFQGIGIGSGLMKQTLRRVQEFGGRLLIAETSTKVQYLPTHTFYQKQGFVQEALIRDFYQPGDGKAVYVFRLST